MEAHFHRKAVEKVLHQVDGSPFSQESRKKGPPSSRWKPVFAGKPQKGSSIKWMEAHFRRKAAKKVLHQVDGSPFSQESRKKGHPSSGWKPIFAGKKQKRSSIKWMEAHFHRKAVEKVLHQVDGSPFSQESRKKGPPLQGSPPYFAPNDYRVLAQ
ncbi:hypothetical protein [Mesobacillus campisalis]|uniref:hypothetical protein n=1 Tax=Mesobacillus campisalis TaxID=1408103 RepID=UPI0012E0F5EA|nr:hypothetical protein [Mesobacillus campisalis]